MKFGFGPSAVYQSNAENVSTARCTGPTTKWSELECSYYIRPIVTILADKLDIDDTSDGIGSETNPWKLK